MWNNKDYESIGWHDCAVHSFAIKESENGNGLLVLDIDYIVDCIHQENGEYIFSIAPAKLVFCEVSDLSILLNYTKCSAEITPFTMEGIFREPYIYPNGHEVYRWIIEVNWPSGRIEFLASDFNMTLTGDPIQTSNQCLSR